MKRIVVLKADGSEELMEAPITLEKLHKAVGGYVEHVRVLDRIVNAKPRYTSMFVNDTGLLDGLPRNAKATEIYQRNIRAQYPNDPQPFHTAGEEYRKRCEEAGANFIDLTPHEAAGYEEDPWISGNAVYFEGYTCEEADALFED